MRHTKETCSDAWNFHYTNFAAQWSDGLPLGNGGLGALMMDHKLIKFPLAHATWQPMFFGSLDAEQFCNKSP